MKQTTRCLALYLLLLIPASFVWAQQTGIKAFLSTLPHQEITSLKNDAHFQETYELKFLQHLDHQSPEKGQFVQRIYVSYVGPDAPVIFETEGYDARGAKANELSKVLNANQIRVEYRFYGESKPDPINWNYLSNRLAVEDLHRIRVLFGQHFKGPWVSTGISKGGETTLIYKRFYPDDVQASVPYVAPLILGVEDPRTDEWIASTGPKKCRKDIAKFQKAVLKRSDEMLPFIKEYLERKSYGSKEGVQTILEYMVLEYPFSFWQWGGVWGDIPNSKAEASELYKHLSKVVSPYYYTDEGIRQYEPSFYQHLRELGYYGYPHDHLKKWLKAVPDPTNADFAPQGVDMSYNDQFIPDVLNWLADSGNNIIYVYGEMDTWTACAVTPDPKTNSVRMIAADYHHASRIKHLNREQQAEVFTKLSSWLGIKID